ncbi:MAG: hypothetical protein R2765_06000 [Ferruginibacter sp.]
MAWSNLSDGYVYSGTHSATLTITAPLVTMSGNYYRVVITGAAPCAPVTSFQVVLTVNPLPVVVIAASPYTRLVPGLTNNTFINSNTICSSKRRLYVDKKWCTGRGPLQLHCLLI